MIIVSDAGPIIHLSLVGRNERKASLILSDDRQARLAAGRLGFSVIGTVGILAEAKRKRLVPALAPVLLALKEKGVWLSNLLIQKILADVGEPLE